MSKPIFIDCGFEFINAAQINYVSRDCETGNEIVHLLNGEEITVYPMEALALYEQLLALNPLERVSKCASD